MDLFQNNGMCDKIKVDKKSRMLLYELQFYTILKDKGLRKSMSRKGICWDNASQESLFGQMKDIPTGIYSLKGVILIDCTDLEMLADNIYYM